MFRLRFVLLFAAFFVGTAAVAEDVVSAPRSIDVVVTDGRGNHISGLAQSDFQILEDGTPRSTAKFAALARPADGSDLQPRRNILLIFDETSISMSARRTTIDALKSFVDTRVRPIDRVMVVTIAGVGGVFPATSWTAKKDDLLTALEKAAESSIGNKGFERREAERNIRSSISFAQQAEADNNGQPIPMTFDTLMGPGRQYAGVMQQEARATAIAFNDAFGFLGSGPGKKIAVIAGGGLSTRPGSDIFQYLENLRQQAMMGSLGQSLTVGSQSANPLAETSRYQITDLVRDLAQNAHDRGIVIYTVDPDTSGTSTAAVEQDRAQDMSEEFTGVADRLSGYQLLSGLTGGLTLTGRGPASVTAIADDLDTHYVLGYTQTLTAKGTLPKTEVKLNKGGYKVRSAFTGGPETKEAEIQDTVIANQATGAVWSNDLNIALFKDPPQPDGMGRRVKLRVLIPVKSLKLVQEGNDYTGAFAVYISTGDEKGNASAINRQVHDLRWPAEKMPEMMEKTIGFTVDVVMRPGRNQISVGVLDQRSHQMGFAKTNI